MLRKRVLLIAVVALLGAALATVGVLANNDRWATQLAGQFELPVRDTQAQGQAIFKLSDDGNELHYKLIAANIDNVFMAHIHCGTPGVNGPIVVWLYPSTAPVPGPTGQGRSDGVVAEGTVTGANVISTAK